MPGLRPGPRPAAARERRINLRVVDGDTLGISLDETTTPRTVQLVLESFGLAGGPAIDLREHDMIPAALQRGGELLAHPVFHQYR